MGLRVNGKADEHPAYSKKRKAVVPLESSSTSSTDVLSRLESSVATLSAAFTTMHLTLTGKLEDLSTQLKQVQADISEMKPICSTSSTDVLSRLESSVATLSAAFTTMHLTLTGKFEDLSTQLKQVQADISEMKPIVMGFDVPEQVEISDDEDDDEGPLFQPRTTVIQPDPVGVATSVAPHLESSDVPSAPVTGVQTAGGDGDGDGDGATNVDTSVQPNLMESVTHHTEDVTTQS